MVECAEYVAKCVAQSSPVVPLLAAIAYNASHGSSGSPDHQWRQWSPEPHFFPIRQITVFFDSFSIWTKNSFHCCVRCVRQLFPIFRFHSFIFSFFRLFSLIIFRPIFCHCFHKCMSKANEWLFSSSNSTPFSVESAVRAQSERRKVPQKMSVFSVCWRPVVRLYPAFIMSYIYVIFRRICWQIGSQTKSRFVFCRLLMRL